MDGNPIDDILTSTERALGVTFTPEEREQMKAKYKGDAELAFQDMIKSTKKYKNIDFSYKERLDMKSKYKVPLAWVDVMALSENPKMRSDIKNEAGESSAAGYWQVTAVHEPYIKQMFGVSHADFIKNPDIQERYVTERLEPEYNRNLSEFKNIAKKGVEEGRYKDYENLMVKGKFTDDQIKALNHVLGSDGASYFLKTGTFAGSNPERKARDVKRTLGEVINIRQKYGVPSFLSDQYDFVSTEETTPPQVPAEKPAPKGAMPPGRTVSPVIDWSKGTVTNIDPVTKQPIKPTKKAEPKEQKKQSATDSGYVYQPGPSLVNQYQVSTQGETTQNAGEYFQSGVRNESFYSEKKVLEAQKVNNKLGSTNQFQKYDPELNPGAKVNLDDEKDLEARDKYKQLVNANTEMFEGSKYKLKEKYGANVEKDIEQTFANNASYIAQIESLQDKITKKYSTNSPVAGDIAAVSKDRAILQDKIINFDTQLDSLVTESEKIKQDLEDAAQDPEMTQARYDVLYANAKLQLDELTNQFNNLSSDRNNVVLEYNDAVSQESGLIEKYNAQVDKLKAEYEADPDIARLNKVFGDYQKNFKKIENYRNDPQYGFYFNNYIQAASNLTDLGKSRNVLFADEVSAEKRAEALTSLADNFVKFNKSSAWSPTNMFYDLFNNVKSSILLAPATSIIGAGFNQLKKSIINTAADLTAFAATAADFIGEDKLATKLRVGDLYGFSNQGLQNAQKIVSGAIRSDIGKGGFIEDIYTVKEGDEELIALGLSPKDRVVVEDGVPILFRDSDGFEKKLPMLIGVNTTEVVKDYLKDKGDSIETEKEFARGLVQSMPSMIDFASLIFFNYAAAPRILKFAPALGKAGAGKVATFGFSTFQQYGDVYNSYLEKGLSPDKAAKYALGQSAGVSLLELLGGLESKVAGLDNIAAQNSFAKVRDTTLDLFSRGKIGKLDALSAIGKGFVAAMKEGGSEVGEELLQGWYENVLESFATNTPYKSMSSTDVLNTVFSTIAIVGAPATIQGVSAGMQAKSDILTSAFYNAAKNPEQFQKDIKIALDKGDIDIAKSIQVTKFINYIKDELDTYDNITDEQGAALSGLIGTRYSLENRKKTTENDSAKKKLDEQIQQINTIIEEVATGKRKVEVDPFVKPLYKEEQPEADRVPTKKEFSDIVYATMPKEWQDMSKEEAWKSFQELPVQDQIKFFNTATGKKEEVAAPSTTAAGLTKEQQTELDKVNKRAERIQRTLQEDTAVQEEGDEPLLTAEQKKKLETELQTLNQRRDAIQKQSTAAVPVQPGAEGRQGVGGQVQAEPEVTTREGQEAKIQAEEEVAAPALKDVKSTAEALKGKTEGLLIEPTTEQLAKEAKDKNLVTYNFDKESDIPDAFKGKISSRGEVKGKEVIRVTLPKSMAEYLLAKDDPQAIAEAYHKAKKDGSNPALVEAVEGLLGTVPTPTPTTTEKVSQKAAEAPQKANTVQGFELTKKDGTKAAPAEYRKNPNTGKWGRVNAKGGITPISSPAQVKQLEDALSSQTKAAAETRKAEAPAKGKEQWIEVPERVVSENKGPLAENNAETRNDGTLYTLAEDLPVFKGTKGKRNIDGTLRTAHPDIKGSFVAADKKIAERYKGEGELISISLPKGTTVETVRISLKGDIPISQYRQLETEAVNASKADVVKLVTMDARGVEAQYIIKNPELKKQLRDLGDTEEKELAKYREQVKQQEEVAAPSPTSAETKAPEAQTATAETILEPIGKTSAEREKQIEKFFTSAAGKDKAESSQMAKLTNNIWNSVAKFFGARNAQTANQWIQSKVALIGKTTTTEAGKLGTPRFQNIPSLQDVESTTKALENLNGSDQFLKTAKRIMPNRGITGGAIITDIDGVELAEVEINTKNDNAIEIENLSSRAAGQGKGFGTKALTILKNIADIHGVKIFLYPEPIKLLQLKGLDKEALIKFYEKNNFKYWKPLGQSVYNPKTPQEVAEAYHKAKKDGSNPALVKAVEGLLAPGVQFQGDTDNPYTFAEAAEAVANNLITEIDRMIKERSNLANIKKRGFTKSQAAAQVRDLRKIKEDLLQAKKDPKWQVDAYHGTPYVFDKFSTEKIGTGEGAQAFGWGLYFTDLESIARSYAKEISQTKISEGIFSQEGEEFLKHAFLEGKTNLSLNDIKDLYYKKHPISKPLPKSEEKIIYGDDYDDIIKYRKLQEDTYEKRKNEIKEESEKIARPTLYKTSLFKGKKPGDYTFLEWDKRIDDATFNKIKNAIEDKYGKKLEDYDGTPVLDLIDLPAVRGGSIMYKTLSRALKGDKNASLFLLEAGIDGIKYPAESSSRGATADTARGFNYVIFDENDVTIEERVQFQQDAAKFRAAVITTAQNKLIVAALESPNASSFVHENFHMFEGDLTAAEKQTIIDSYNDSFGEKETEFTTDVSEWGARMWEKYFSNGRQLTAAEVKDTKKRKALQDIFDNFTEWLKGVYEGFINYTNTKGVTKEVNIAPEVQALFDNIMGITTTPTPVAAETQVEAEAKTAEELSADIEADIEAAEAKEQEAMAKAFKGNKKQTAANDLIKNPKSVDALPQDLLEDLYNLAAEAKYTPALKKKCD